ncbi:unnamed protein product [Menidia menidia]|uniref:(Atlantic silverside) hypothetical protein n=1 Tax=Menidia menidia TaxID=238744 RepID=A0A8S4BS34_9TELE|nr:unnamed protein product [Menidia menidia]
MKYYILLFWTLTASVSCQKAQDNEVQIDDIPDGIKLSCKDADIEKPDGTKVKELELRYHNENSGVYSCSETSKAHVKFRTCDNCVELDMKAIAGIVVGDVVATVVVGVAVYLLASKAQSGPVPSHKKRSDRQPLVRNDASITSDNDNYQPLRQQRRDEYDVLRR